MNFLSTINKLELFTFGLTLYIKPSFYHIIIKTCTLMVIPHILKFGIQTLKKYPFISDTTIQNISGLCLLGNVLCHKSIYDNYNNIHLLLGSSSGISSYIEYVCFHILSFIFYAKIVSSYTIYILQCIILLTSTFGFFAILYAKPIIKKHFMLIFNEISTFALTYNIDINFLSNPNFYNNLKLFSENIERGDNFIINFNDFTFDYRKSLNMNVITEQELEQLCPIKCQSLKNNMDEIKYDNQKECMICCEEINQLKMHRVLPCNHTYHPQCIDKWLLERSGSCPLCKQNISR